MGDAPGTVPYDPNADHLRAVPLPGTLLLPLAQRNLHPTLQRTTAFAWGLQPGGHVSCSQNT